MRITLFLVLISFISILNSCQTEFEKYECRKIELEYQDISKLKNGDFFILDSIKVVHTDSFDLVRKGIAVASSSLEINGLNIETNNEILKRSFRNFFTKNGYKILGSPLNKNITITSENDIKIFIRKDYPVLIKCIE